MLNLPQLILIMIEEINKTFVLRKIHLKGSLFWDFEVWDSVLRSGFWALNYALLNNDQLTKPTDKLTSFEKNLKRNHFYCNNS